MPEPKEPPQMPQSMEAEAQVLGTLIDDFEETWPQLSLLFECSDLYFERHRLVCMAAVELHNAGHPVSISTITAALERAGTLEKTGGREYLQALMDGFVSLETSKYHAAQIRELATKRRIALKADQIKEAALNGHDALALREMLQQSAESIQDAVEQEQVYTTAVDISGRLKQTTWLWERWIPRGYVTGLVARPDAGKSSVALDFCRRLLSGTAWPDGAINPVNPTNARILWIDTEAAQALFIERAVRWNLPLDRFIFPADPLREIQLDDEADYRWIERALSDWKPALMVVDSLSGGHSGDENSSDFVKTMMKRLSLLARDHDIGLIVIHHLRKANALEPDRPIDMDQIRGSSAFAAMCRSIIGIDTPDKLNNDRAKRLSSIKNNLALRPPPLGYEITDQGPAWGSAPETPKPHRAIDDAREYLLDALREGRRLSSDIIEEAHEDHGISEKTLRRACKDLNVKALKEDGKGGRWFWELSQNTGEEYAE